jgi:hypothetical protein
MNAINITVTGRLGDDPRQFTTRDGTTRRSAGANTSRRRDPQNLCAAHGTATTVRPADSGSGLGAGTLSD